MNDGFTVMLDSRALRGPKGAQVVLPTRALADHVAGEWAGQGEPLVYVHRGYGAVRRTPGS